MESDSKSELILEKARIRFAHFGIQKTTMNEIADDVAMSKPSVYYYFPDKTSLIIAVIEKICAEYAEQLITIFSKSGTLKLFLEKMLELRNEYFQKYFMMHLSDQSDLTLLKDELRPVVNKIRSDELKIVESVLNDGLHLEKNSSFEMKNYAELFIDALSGISTSVFLRNEKCVMPGSEVFMEILARQRDMTEIFLLGMESKCMLINK